MEFDMKSHICLVHPAPRDNNASAGLHRLVLSASFGQKLWGWWVIKIGSRRILEVISKTDSTFSHVTILGGCLQLR